MTIDDTQYQWQVDDTGAGYWRSAPDDSTSLNYTITSSSLAGKYLRLGVRAHNQYGWSAWSYSSASQQITQMPAFTAASPPTVADVNRPYGTYTFAASGYRVTYSDDSAGLTGLPPGMSINSSGLLTGTPTARGTFTYRVRATNDSGTVTTGVLTLTVSSGVTHSLTITRSPVGGPSRSLLATQPIIEVRDDSGLLVRDDTISVTSTGSIGGSQASGLATVNGVATFSNLTLGGLVNTNYVMTFIPASNPSADETAVTQVTPGLATTLDLSTLPVAAAQAGAVMTSQPVVQIKDADGNLVTYDDTTTVTLTPQTGGFVGPTQSSVATANAVDGVATFSGVRFGGPVGVAKILTFTANRNNVGPALADDSASVMSTATGPAYKLVVATQATSPSPSGAVFAQPPVLQQQDMAGNVVTINPQATVTATLVEEAQPYDVLVGPVTQETASGVATFAGLGISGLAGTTYTMRFTSPGLVSADDTVVPSVGAPARLSLTSTGARLAGNASYDDTSFNPQPIVRLVDSGNNPLSGSGVVVTAALVSGTGVLRDDTATTVNGLASFSDLQLDGLTGTYVLRFSAPSYASIDDTVQMLRGAQTVTLTPSPIPAKNLDDTPFSISATTSSGLLASFRTSTPSVCTVGGDDTVLGGVTGAAVSIIGAGTCTVIASQAGDSRFEPAVDDSESFAVSKANQAPLTLVAPTTATAGQTVTLATVGGSGTGAVTYAETSDPGGICTLTSGVVTFTGTGSACQFTATKADDANFNARTSPAATITVPASGSGGKSGQTVAFTSASPLKPLDDDTYVATAAATSGLTATISVQSGSPAVCTATSGASPVTVTFTGAGTCVLQADQAGDGRFAAATPTATQTILVYANSGAAGSGQTNQSITFAQPSDRRFGSPNFRLSATATSGLPISFSSTTSGVCVTTTGGIVSLVAPGTCTIVAAQAGDATYAAADSVRRSFQVTAGLPSAPRILSSSSGSASATLSFATPDDTGGSPIVAYTILATPVSGGTTVATSACSASPCTIRGLVDDSAYTLQIAAINVIGTGPYSAASTSVTPKTCGLCAGAPGGPGSPGGPVGQRQDDTTVILNWSQPSSLGGGTFVAYDIYYRAVGAAWPSTPYVSVTPITTTSTVVSGLTPGVVYEFLIVVVTTSNPRQTPPDPSGPNASTVTVGTPTVPTAPQSLAALYITDTSIMVSWAYPASDGGSPITGYTVNFSPLAACTPVVLDDTSNTASCTVVGLTTGTTYGFTVTATNAIGTSTAASASYTTPGVAPVPPNPPNPPVPPGPTPVPTTPPGPQPVPVPAPAPGEADVVVDGNPLPGTTMRPGDGTVTIGGDDSASRGGAFTLTFASYVGSERVPLGPGGVLTAPERSRIEVRGTGYAPNSRVSVYVGGTPLLLLGTITTTSSGSFGVRLLLPESVSPGDYVLQVNGYNVGAKIRSVNVGLRVTATQWIEISGQREVQRVTVEGLTGVMVSGTVVVPMVKLGKAKTFIQGVGLRKVDANGGFEWQRKVAKGKSIWVYFTVMPVKSNTVALMAKTTRT